MAESVLQQPPVPVPIVAVQGGGGGGGESVLPQPPAGGEVPIIPVQGGGGVIAQLNFLPFNYKTIQQSNRIGDKEDKSNPEKQLIPIDIKIIKNYANLRKSVWNNDTILDNFIQGDKKDIKQLITDRKNVEISGRDAINIFFIYNETDFFKAIKKIRETRIDGEIVNYIIINGISDHAEFSLVFKRFIYYITTPFNKTNKKPAKMNDVNIYFLHNRTQTQIDSIKGGELILKNNNFIMNLEPSYITVVFEKPGEQNKNIVLSAFTEPPTGLKNYILLTNDQSVQLLNIDQSNSSIDIASIDIDKSYSVKKDAFFSGARTKTGGYIQLEFPDVESSVTPAPPAATPAPPAPPAPPAAPAATPAATPAAAATPAVTTPIVKPYLIQLRPEVTIDIGGTIFTIQKPTSEVMTAWNAGTFSESEVAMFKEIGINEDFLRGPHSERKQNLLDRRAGFLQNLVLNQCFKKQNIRYECDMVREFLQDLLELKQIERLNKITRAFSPTNVNVTIVVPPIDDPIDKIEDMLASLFTVVPAVKKRNRVDIRPDLDLAGLPYYGLESLLLGTTASRSSKKTDIPTGALNFSSLFSSFTPAMTFSPGTQHTRKQVNKPDFSLAGLFSKKPGSDKSTTRRWQQRFGF